MHLRLLRQAELGEHGVDVLLDRPFAEHQGRGDAGVVLALGHLRQNVPLAGRQAGDG
jgi:hypothetical protein